MFFDDDTLTVSEQWARLKMQSPYTDVTSLEPSWLPRSDPNETENDIICKTIGDETHGGSLYPDFATEIETENGNHQELVATSWYAQSNCGFTEFNTDGNVKSFVGKVPSKRRRTVKGDEDRSDYSKNTLKYVQRSLTSKKEARDNILHDEIRNLEQTLRSKDPNLGEIHISGCKDLYRQISQCLEHNRCKKNKKKVAAAATYYTLKRYFNPSISEIEHIFDMDHKAVTDAMKRMRTLAFQHPLEFGWLFEKERGQTNLYRYISQHNLPWSVVPTCFAYAKEHDLNMKDDSVVTNLIKRFKT